MTKPTNPKRGGKAGKGIRVLENPEHDQDALLGYLAAGLPHKDIARLTGYSVGSVGTLASRHRDRVTELTIDRFADELPRMVTELRDMALSEGTPASAKLKAIQHWLDRTLGQSMQRSQVQISASVVTKTDAELTDIIKDELLAKGYTITPPGEH